MNVIFMGTPGFAVPTLEKLYESRHKVVLVVTQPDKPSGRGKKIKKSEVKERAEELGLEIFQPDKIKRQENIFIGENMRKEASIEQWNELYKVTIY